MGLTDVAIKKAKPKDKSYKLSDGGGMYLWITPSGGRSWRWAYRYGGKQKLMTHGPYPEVSLADARDRCTKARKMLVDGIDPMAQRKADKTAERLACGCSFAAVAARWLKHWSVGKSFRHVDYTDRRLKADVIPVLGERPIAEIQAPELVRMVKAIEGRGARDIAERALQTVGQIFRYAIANGLAQRNPAAEIRPRDILTSTRTKNYARVDARQLPDLLRKIEVYQGTHTTRLAIKLMALTFVRTTELIQARWSEFDLEAARWDIPSERMKMRSPHIVPLSRQSIEILRTLHSLTGSSELVFSGDRNQKRPMSNNTILKGLERMGYKGVMTGHGFRGLASTILHEQGYSAEHIELQLAHTRRNAVAAAYNHALHLKARTKMMQDWADYLDRTRHSPKVLGLRPRVA
jgi:integrase